MSATILPATLPALGVGAFRDWYRSAEVLAAEERRLIARSWQIVASAEELGEAGSFVATTVAGIPLLVVRDDDGTLRAFHNLCRHRGIPLVSGSGRVGRYLTCPYHQWSFRRDGTLATVPQREQQFPEIDCGALSLFGAAVGEWSGLVFVRAEDDGSSLTSALGELATRLAPFTDGRVREVAKVTYEVACNWKLLVENHVDVYHLWYLHGRSLNHLDHQRFSWEFLGDNWWSQEPHKEAADAPSGLDWLSERDAISIGAHLLFPNVMIVTCGAYLATYDAVPTAPGSTRLTLRIRSTPDAPASALVEGVRTFLAEDVAACEQLQLATGSPAFSFGPTAVGHEEPVRVFHEAIRRRLTC